MDYEHPFVQEVRANPRDDLPRLIFADYLEEAGDPRGELIRVQVALSQLAPGDAERRELELREDELLAEFADQWLEPLRELGAEGISARCLQRGLIERVRIKSEVWLRNADELCRLAPALHCIELRDAASHLPLLLLEELPEQITAIDLSANRLERMDLMEHLVVSTWPDQLLGLSLAFNRFPFEEISLLARGRWPHLQRLNLSMNKLAPQSSRQPSESTESPFPRLEELSLAGNPLTTPGMVHLLDLVQSTNLQELDLATTGIDAAAVRWLAQRQPMFQLETLTLRGNPLKSRVADPTGTLDADLLAIAQRGLKRLDLRSTGCVPDAALIEVLGDGLKY